MKSELKAVYVQDLSIEVPNAPFCFFGDTPSNVEISLESMGTMIADGMFKSALRGKVESKSELGVNYLIEVSQEAIFALEGEINEDALKNLAEREAPAILLPYLRATVANATQMAGFQPAHIAHIHF